ncbi:MAG: hypothetical protein ACI97A_004189 [Planctomycetota bacterium]|jgi:hypothetical protein
MFPTSLRIKMALKLRVKGSQGDLRTFVPSIENLIKPQFLQICGYDEESVAKQLVPAPTWRLSVLVVLIILKQLPTNVGDCRVSCDTRSARQGELKQLATVGLGAIEDVRC